MDKEMAEELEKIQQEMEEHIAEFRQTQSSKLTRIVKNNMDKMIIVGEMSMRVETNRYEEEKKSIAYRKENASPETTGVFAAIEKSALRMHIKTMEDIKNTVVGALQQLKRHMSV